MANPLRPFMIARRAELRLTQAHAASRAKCCAGTWVRWENAFRLPKPTAWVKIAQALDIPLDQLQGAAGVTLLEISGRNAQQPGQSPNEPMKPLDPDRYQFLSSEAAEFDKFIADIDLHKLDFIGWNFHMSEWRSAIREQIRGVDHMFRSLKTQLELFVKLHHSLIGYQKGRMAPLRRAGLDPDKAKKAKKGKPKNAGKAAKKPAAKPAGGSAERARGAAEKISAASNLPTKPRKTSTAHR